MSETNGKKIGILKFPEKVEVQRKVRNSLLQQWVSSDAHIEPVTGEIHSEAKTAMAFN